MKNKLVYLLLTVLLAALVAACSSNTNDPIPEAPSTYRTDLMLRADAGKGEVTLEWLMDPYAESYNIYVGPSKSSLAKIATVPTSITSAPYTVTGLANETVYWFSVTGVNPNGESELATPITATPLASPRPVAPENVRANAEDKQVTVTWDPRNDVDGYTVYCSWQTSVTERGGGYVEVVGQANKSQIVKEQITWVYNTGGESGLVNDRTYTFWVASIKDNVESSASFPAYATPSENPPPLAPNFISADPGGSSGEVALKWGEVTGNGTVTYNIYIDTAKGITKATARKKLTLTVADYVKDDSTTPTTIVSGTGGLTIGMNYYFVVTAQDDNGESTESNELPVTIP